MIPAARRRTLSAQFRWPGTGLSFSGTYQNAIASLSADPTINDGDSSTGVTAATSPPNDVTAAIDLGGDRSVTAIRIVTGYASASITRALEYALSASPTLWTAISLGAAPSHGGVFSLETETVSGLSITARYVRYSVEDTAGSASVREIDITN